MHRRLFTGVALLIPLLLLALLFSLVPLVAATEAPGPVLQVRGSTPSNWRAPQAPSPVADGESLREAGPANFWGWEPPPADEEEEGEYPAWLTNRPPRPPAGRGSPPPAGGQPERDAGPVRTYHLARDVAYPAPGASTPLQPPQPRSVPPVPNTSPPPPTGQYPAINVRPSALDSVSVDRVSAAGSQPAALSSPYSVTLSTVHRGTDSQAFSSSFVFTNTGAAEGSYAVDFYWPNGEYVGSDGPFVLTIGQAHAYDMDSASFGEGTFAGEVIVGGDQPLTGRITTPDYGLISGIVYEPDGSTPMMIGGVSVNRQSDGAGFGGIYNMSDGRFYVGGLPDGDYLVFARGNYPWGSQWYDGKTSQNQADAVNITGAGEATIAFTMQAGGQITGTVYDGHGTPLENVNVDVEQGSYGTCTDANGAYTIQGLPYGDFKAVAGGGWNWCLGMDSTYVREYWQETMDSNLATIIQLSGALDTVTGIDFTLDPGGTITGTVYNSNGSQPLANVNVDVEQGGYGTCTDGSGQYTLAGLSHGEHKVYAGGGWNWCLGSDSLLVTEYYQEVERADLALALQISSTQLYFSDIDFTLDEAAMITGTVYADDGVTPLANINVDVDQGGHGTCSDGSGRYTITGLAYGQYRVQAGGGWNGCTGADSDYVQEYYQETSNWDDAQVFDLNAGNTLVTGIDFTLTQGGRIQGRVTDAGTGLPLASARVSANEYDDGQHGSDGWTNASGYYTITGLIDADYRVGVQGDSLPGYAQQFYPGTFAHHLAGRVAVSAGSTVGGIDFALPPGGRIQGRIIDKDTGQPIPNLNLDASLGDGQGGMGHCTQADGTFVLDGLIYGDYEVQAGGTWNHCLNEPGLYARKYYSDTYDYEQRTLVTINGATTEVLGIDFEMEVGGIISGWVSDDQGHPLENVHVGTGWIGSQHGEGTCSEANGYYEFRALPFGDYIVEAGSDWNSCLDQPSLYITEYYSETHDYNSATPVPLGPGNELQADINFTLELGGRISGRVTAASDGSPLADMWVNADAYDDGGHGGGAWTNASGIYTLTGLISQDYRVAVDPDWTSGFAQQYYPNEFAHHRAARVAVSAGSLVSDIDFNLEPGGVITGVVRDQATGLPLANVNVNSGLIDGEGGAGRCTEADGSFVLGGLIYGDYAVSAGGGWNHCQDRPSEYVETYYDGVYLWDDATRIRVDNPSPVPDINLSLEGGGYIAGNVTETGGAPVEGLQVGALIPSPDCPWCHQWMANADTGPNGDYVVGPLPPLGYAIYACAGCRGNLLVEEYYDDVYHMQDATLITPTAGLTVTNIDFVLDPGVWVTGKVTVPSGYSPEGFQVDVWEERPDGYGTGGQTSASGTYTVPVPPIYDTEWSVAVRPWETDLGAQWAHGFDLSKYTNWDFDLGPGAIITGRITSGGQPVEAIWVNADSPWMGQSDDTDADGTYEIPNLPPGEYRIQAQGWPDYMEAYFGGHDQESATPVRMEEGEIQADISFEVLPIGQIEGHVYESDGSTPIEGVQVVATNQDGLWSAWSQADGYFTLDVPSGDFRVRFIPQPWSSRVMAYYGGSYTYRDASVVSVPPYRPSEVSVDLNMTLEMPATLDGVVRESGSGDPVEGIHVVVENHDPAVDRRVSWWGDCTDASGQYHIENIWPGENQVWAVGTCGGTDHGVVTGTLVADPGGSHTLDLTVTAGSAPQRPFTIRTDYSWDFTPLSSGGGTSLNSADQILPALFAPLVNLDDQNEWYSELLAQVPTLDNGGASVAGDQLVVTYVLTPGLLWSDGAPLTSDDIRFTWEMMTQPSTDVDSYHAQVSPLWQIEAISTPDPQTAVVTYRPEYFPPGYLGAITYLLPEHVLAGEHRVDVRWNSDYAHYPVGNGPYVVVDYVPGSHIDLRPNPNYHKRSQGLPLIEDVRFLFTFHPDWALPVGMADVALDVSPEFYDSFDIPTLTRAQSVFYSIVPNTDRPFFQDAQVRQALYHALDREGYLADQSPYNEKANAYLPPGHAMYTDTLTLYDFDLATAAGLLDAAGWVDSNSNGIRDKDGVEFEFDLVYPVGGSGRQALCLMWQADLATLGIDANVIPMDWGELIEAGRRGDLDAYTVGWGFDNRFDPMAYTLYHSSQNPSAYNSYWGGTAQNHWADPDPAKTDAWLEAARTELDADALRGYYADHLARFTGQLPNWVYEHSTRTDAYTAILLNFGPGQATPVTWNVEEWNLLDNPYDLAVRKTLAPGSPAPQPGETIVYEIQVHNAGDLAVTNAGLVDHLPGKVVFVSADPAQDSHTGRTLNWSLGDIAAHSSAAPVRVSVQIPNTVTHGTSLTNTVEVYGDQPDSEPANNAFVHVVEVRDDVDLAITKSGVGQPAVGADYVYLIDYANWGGAPATDVVITDTLPPEVLYWSADPPPDAEHGDILTWTFPLLEGNQWAGQIQVRTELTATGTVENEAGIDFPGLDVDLGNNVDSHIENVSGILSPIITQPTQGTTDGTPTFRGQAPSEAVIDLWDIQEPLTPTWVASTTAALDGAWELPLALAEGTYIMAATATKAGPTSEWSNTSTIQVRHDLDLDTDLVAISSDGVDISRGVVRAERRTLAHRMLDIEVVVSGTVVSGTNLYVNENGLFIYRVPATSVTDLGAGKHKLVFRLWLSEPHSTYDILVEWNSDGQSFRESMLFILIDPAGFVYDQSLVDSGSTITNSLLLNGVITAHVWLDDQWEVWPAEFYGQTNPQATDPTVDDGVPEPGYYSFLTPPGKYIIEVRAPGYQPYQSDVLTVINDPIYLDIGLQPVVGGGGRPLAPAVLSGSYKQVDAVSAGPGDTLTYDIWLANSGEMATEQLDLSDAIPVGTAYADGSLSWSGAGQAAYNSGQNAITWTGVLTAGGSVHISFQVVVDAGARESFDVVNVAAVSGAPQNLASLPELQAVTTVEVSNVRIYLPLVLKNH